MALDSSGPSQPPDAHSPPQERIARSAGLAGVATLTSRVLGLVREQVIAGVFGASNEMDAFLVAFRIPNLIRDLFAEGAMSSAFVPAFTKQLTQGGRIAAWRLGNYALNALLLVSGALVVLGIIFARPIVSMYAPEFADVPGKLDLTITLTRLVLPFLTLAALGAAVMGMLNSLQHYFIPALSPATFNVATILCLAVLSPWMPALGLPPIMILAIATLAGGIGQIALQWPSLRREGFRYAPVLDLKDRHLWQILLLMGPGTLGMAATQVNLLITTQLATYQGTGAVSWLQYAFRLMYLPIGLFGVSIATAVLPTVARHAADDDRSAIARTVARGMGLMLAVNIPASIGLIVLSDDIVQLLFERGRFLPTDTVATAAALRCYAVGLIGYSAARISSPVFYALGKSRVAVMVSTLTIAINLVLSIVLVRLMGFSGLALATALCALFNGAMLLVLLRRHLGPFDGRALGGTLGKTLLASLAMALAARWTLGGMRQVAPAAHVISELARVMVSIGAGVIVLVVAARLLRIREFDEFLRESRRRLRFARP